MRLLALLIAALLGPSLPALASIIASTNYSGTSCNGNTAVDGPVSATTSFTCPGATASASILFDPTAPVAFFSMQVSGSKIGGIPPAGALAAFDVDILVTGVDQPGYLYLRAGFSLSPEIIRTTRIQSSTPILMGYDLSVENPGPLFLPYQPGVPVHIFGSLRGGAGAIDVLAPGDFDSSMSIYMKAIATNVLDSSGFEAPPIRGSELLLVPEPSFFPIVLAVLALLLCLRITGRYLHS